MYRLVRMQMPVHIYAIAENVPGLVAEYLYSACANYAEKLTRITRRHGMLHCFRVLERQVDENQLPILEAEVEATEAEVKRQRRLLEAELEATEADGTDIEAIAPWNWKRQRP